MSNKITTIYSCSKCGAQFLKWNGRCLECGAWGTLSEEIKDSRKDDKQIKPLAAVDLIDLNTVMNKNKSRISTNISEIDRVLGGGIVPGSLSLLSGEPGIGKSTMLAQIASGVGTDLVLYISGEESALQIKDRFNRLHCDLEKIKFLSENNVEKIIATAAKAKPGLLIIDSIQTVYSLAADSEPGSISQIKAATFRFLELAKQNNISVILTGHITKDGQVAGPKSLEHIVDTVMYLETETAHHYRLLRATKNRFGSVNEMGLFEMTGTGFKEVTNPSGVFVESRGEKISGSIISSVMEGTRPFLIEIQALVTKTVFGYPQRKASGFDLNRLQVLTAVLTKRANVNLTNQDVILNVVGGLRISDPSLDLAVCLAIASSLLNQTIGRDTIVLGEVGLGGEVRTVAKLKERLNEAAKLGFKKAIIPAVDIKPNKLKITKIKQLIDLIDNF